MTAPGQLPQTDPRVAYMCGDMGPFRCDACEHFGAPATCDAVLGKIDPAGCCNLFCPCEAPAKPTEKRSPGFQIVKIDALQGIVYGWGNVCVEAGDLVTDRQGDQWEPEELEKSVVDFMLNCRESGVMHAGESVAKVVASLVTTPDVVKAFFGEAVARTTPIGWIIGVKVDKALLRKVLDGEYLAFSIQGSGDRIPVDA